MKERLLKELEKIKYMDCAMVSHWITKITEAQVDRKLSDQDVIELIQKIQSKIKIREIVDGDFAEGTYVIVNVDGDVVRRKTRWSKEAGDLYILKDNKKYFYGEFK